MSDLDQTQPIPTRPDDAGPPAPATSDPDSPAAPLAPVRPPGRSRTRWGVTLVVVALVTGTVVGAAMLMTAEAGAPDVLGWTPADRATYAELRLDLPGDQRAEVATFLSAFPGFDDRSALDTKIGEALDRIMGEATDGRYDYSTDIEPWFGGTLAIGIGTPATGAGSDDDPPMLLLAGVKDPAKAEAWVAGAVAETGTTTTTETHRGVTITLVDVSEPQGGGEARSHELAFAVYGPVLGLGDPASVRASIDTQGNGGLSATGDFEAAAATLPGNRVGMLFMDTDAFADGAAAMPDLGEDVPVPSLPALFGDLSPGWFAASLRAESGSLVMETRQPHVDKLGPAVNAESKLPGLVPGDTVFLAVGHDIGGSIQRMRTLLAEDPELKETLDGIEQAAGMLGGLDALVGWMDELGVVVVRDGSEVGGGLVVTTRDPAATGRLFTMIRTFLAFGVEVREESHAGATITIIDLGELADLGIGGPGTDLPDVPPGNFELAWTVSGDVVVLGTGPAFVKNVLGARDGESLADTTRFKDLLDRAGASHASVSWIDLQGLRGLVEGMLDAGDRAEYDKDVRPYLESIDAIIATSVAGDIDRGTIIISTSR